MPIMKRSRCVLDSRMPPTPTSDPLESAYQAETAELVRARLPYAVGYYLLAAVALLALEWRHHPNRATWLAWRDSLDAGVLIGALVLSRVQRRPPWPTLIAVGIVLWIALAEAVYGAWMGTQLDRYVMVQVALLNLAVVLFPWGWRAQLVVVSASLVGYTLGAPSMGTSDAVAFG